MCACLVHKAAAVSDASVWLEVNYTLGVMHGQQSR